MSAAAKLSPIAACGVTVLVCDSGCRATKRWRLGPDGAPVSDNYDAGKLLAVEAHPVGSLDDLAVLVGRLSSDPRSFIIRGEPRPGVVGTRGRRLQHDDPKTGDGGRFTDVPRRWCAHDLDKVSIGRPYDLRQPGAAREALLRLRELLSPEWRRAACFAQLTSSAGFGDPSRVSARLWFWLDRPVGRGELEAWAKATHAPVDVAVYRAVQPHYVARPIFVPPVVDPISERAVRLEGDPVVRLDHYAPPRPAPRQPYAPRPRDDGSGDAAGRRYARATLDRLAEGLASAREGDRHGTLHAAARRAGGLTPGGWLAPHEITDELVRAAHAAGLTGARAGEVHRTIEDGIACGAARWPWDPPALGGAR